MTAAATPLLALLSGAALFASTPPSPAPWLTFVALIPLAIAVERCATRARPGPSRPRIARPLGVGLVFGWSHQLLLLSWVPATVALERPALAVPFTLLLAGTLAGLEAMAVVSMVELRRRGRASLPLAVALCWVTLEWARAIPGPWAFPWSGIALGLTPWPEALALAEVAGEAGVAFWVAGAAGLAATGWVRRGRAGIRDGVLAAALVLGGVVAGAWRMRALAPEPVARVGVVQPNQSLALRRNRARARDDGLARVERVLADASREVALWLAPEAVLPVRLDQDSAAVRRLANATGGLPLVLGALGSSPEGRPTNVARVIENGRLQPDVYVKTRLVPGWEATPGWGGALLDADGFVPGSGEAPLRAAGHSWGVLVCFESLFSSLAREHVRNGAVGFLALTNDGWFNDGRPAGSRATEQHLAHLVLRAVETRTGIARAANSGVSALIGPDGRVERRLEAHEAGVLDGTLRRTSGTTLYVRTGNVLAPLCAGLLALLLLRPDRTRPASRLPTNGASTSSSPGGYGM